MAHTAEEASHASLGEQLRTFSKSFWIANAMEMFERLAYYGLRTVLPLYMVLSVQSGGPEFDHIQKGAIFAAWAAVQSFLPVFTGGYADRYGYKLTVSVAIAIKVAGYLIMAFAVDIGAAITGGESATVAGHPAVYWSFMAGALLLAAGTAIFKPGLQGIIATQVRADNASLGWSLFYQLVNVGGFLGPYLASVMRLMAWKWVFVSCAVVVCVNYLLLLTFPEPDKEVPEEDHTSFLRVLWNALIGICEPRIMGFLVVFSGFWMMFYQLFDLLPNFIADWVDSSMVLGAVVAPVLGLFGAGVPEEWGGMVPAEQMINLNAGMIVLLAPFMGYLTGKLRSMTAMILGILISAVAIWGLGVSMSGWIVLAAIALFSLGEMAASPTKMRYFASIAPPGRKGLYLGYVNATTGIGWSIGSLVAGEMYQADGDKVVLGRRYLVQELGRAQDAVDALPKDDVIPAIANAMSTTAGGVRELLWATYAPQEIWTWFAIVGVVSMVGLIVFDRITRLNTPLEPWLLVGLTAAVSAVTYGIGWAVLFAILMTVWVGLSRYAPGALPSAPSGEGEDAA